MKKNNLIFGSAAILLISSLLSFSTYSIFSTKKELIANAKVAVVDINPQLSSEFNIIENYIDENNFIDKGKSNLKADYTNGGSVRLDATEGILNFVNAPKDATDINSLSSNPPLKQGDGVKLTFDLQNNSNIFLDFKVDIMPLFGNYPINVINPYSDWTTIKAASQPVNPEITFYFNDKVNEPSLIKGKFNIKAEYPFKINFEYKQINKDDKYTYVNDVLNMVNILNDGTTKDIKLNSLGSDEQIPISDIVINSDKDLYNYYLPDTSVNADIVHANEFIPVENKNFISLNKGTLNLNDFVITENNGSVAYGSNGGIITLNSDGINNSILNVNGGSYVFEGIYHSIETQQWNPFAHGMTPTFTYSVKTNDVLINANGNTSVVNINDGDFTLLTPFAEHSLDYSINNVTPDKKTHLYFKHKADFYNHTLFNVTNGATLNINGGTYYSSVLIKPDEDDELNSITRDDFYHTSLYRKDDTSKVVITGGKFIFDSINKDAIAGFPFDTELDKANYKAVKRNYMDNKILWEVIPK